MTRRFRWLRTFGRWWILCFRPKILNAGLHFAAMQTAMRIAACNAAHMTPKKRANEREEGAGGNRGILNMVSVVKFVVGIAYLGA